MSITLLIADDHELIREGLRETFKGTDVTVIGEASTADGALRLALDQPADALILDISWMTGETKISDQGFEILKALRSARPNLAILMYSCHDAPGHIRRCRQLGANGYLVKGMDDRLLPHAVHDVIAGLGVWPTESYRA